jgi:hypothetical protein
MGLRRRRRARRRRSGHSAAEANLHAQCAAVGETPPDESVIDLAALEHERLFAAHPRAEQDGHGSRSR